MKNKIIQFLNNLNLPKLATSKYTKLVAYIFGFITFILFIMFLVGWIYNLQIDNHADLQIILDLLTIFCSTGFIALFMTLLKLGVDKDKDGIADILQEDNNDIHQ